MELFDYVRNKQCATEAKTAEWKTRRTFKMTSAQCIAQKRNAYIQYIEIKQQINH